MVTPGARFSEFHRCPSGPSSTVLSSVLSSADFLSFSLVFFLSFSLFLAPGALPARAGSVLSAQFLEPTAHSKVLDPTKGDDWNVILEKILGSRHFLFFFC